MEINVSKDECCIKNLIKKFVIENKYVNKLIAKMFLYIKIK